MNTWKDNIKMNLMEINCILAFKERQPGEKKVSVTCAANSLVSYRVKNNKTRSSGKN
jgi:hypothetical protein